MIDAIEAVVGPLLGTLELVIRVQRHMHPPLAPKLAEVLAPRAELIAAPLASLEAADASAELGFVRDRLVPVARQTVELVTAFVDAAKGPEEPIGLYRALRRLAPIQEALYPLAPMLPPVSRWFLPPERRGDDALVDRLRAGVLRDDVRVGVLHASNERDARGGFSLFVPEDWDGARAMPVVVALHGGSGHGRDFLWSWLREARAAGVMVLSPTSVDRTWSIMGGEDVDADRLVHMLDSVGGRYPIDRARLLLTGMSDGGTYALLCGLYEGAPFTHLAPACGVLHPFVLAGGGLARARGRPIYLIHGALDWMFPVGVARAGCEALEAAGARVTYRELEDLSHTYPRDENPRILEWLLAEPGPTDDAGEAPTAYA